MFSSSIVIVVRCSLIVLLITLPVIEGQLNPPVDVPGGLDLNRLQKLAIEQNWSVMRENLQENGVELFVEFFKAHPSYQQKFKSFADLPLEELPGNEMLQKHANRFMDTFSEIVSKLDDIVGLSELLIRIGKIHARQEVVIEEFQEFEMVFTGFLQEKLGDSFTPSSKEAWMRAFQLMNPIIDQGMKKSK